MHAWHHSRRGTPCRAGKEDNIILPYSITGTDTSLITGRWLAYALQCPPLLADTNSNFSCSYLDHTQLQQPRFHLRLSSSSSPANIVLDFRGAGGRGGRGAREGGRGGTPCREGTIILLTMAPVSVLRYPLLVGALPPHMADSESFVLQTGSDQQQQPQFH